MSGPKKLFICGACNKRMATLDGARTHALSHRRARVVDIFQFCERIGTAVQDEEPSMADLMIEAQMNRAMGIGNEDWLEDMLP